MNIHTHAQQPVASPANTPKTTDRSVRGITHAEHRRRPLLGGGEGCYERDILDHGRWKELKCAGGWAAWKCTPTAATSSGAVPCMCVYDCGLSLCFQCCVGNEVARVEQKSQLFLKVFSFSFANPLSGWERDRVEDAKGSRMH